MPGDEKGCVHSGSLLIEMVLWVLAALTSLLPTSAQCHCGMRYFLVLSNCICPPNSTKRQGWEWMPEKREPVHLRHRQVKPIVLTHTRNQMQGPWRSSGIHELQVLLLDRCLCFLQCLFNGRNISVETRDLASLRLTCCFGMYVCMHGVHLSRLFPSYS